MMPTTVPTMLIALTIYVSAGFSLVSRDSASLKRIDSLTMALRKSFLILP